MMEEVETLKAEREVIVKQLKDPITDISECVCVCVCVCVCCSMSCNV